MALSLRSLLVLLSFVLLPLAAHAQAPGGGTGSGATTGAGPSGIGSSAAPILAPEAPAFGNQGARQAPAAGPAGTGPTTNEME